MSIQEQVKSALSGNAFDEASLEKFIESGLPTKKNELWKYTNIEKYWPEFDLASQAPTELSSVDKDPNFSHIFFVNGQFQANESDIAVEVLNESNRDRFLGAKSQLKELLADEPVFNLVESQAKNQYLLELNGVADKPVIIHNVYSSKVAKHSSAHLNVIANANSETTIIESHTSDDDAQSFINNATSFYLKGNAQATLIKMQTLGAQTVQVQNIRALVSRDANFESFTIDIGAKLSRNNISIRLDGEGANCCAHGLYTLQNDQQSDTNSFIHHNRPHTESSQLYKGIMNDKSHGIFTGLIRVEKDAQLINSDQLNKNLLLSKGAHAHSRPQLEIYADDVKCAHGSTTGQMSDDQVFYFEARGVSREKAQKLLAQAFAYDVILKIKNKTARIYAQNILEQNFIALKSE
ncbi:MAG: Fe-S cluster assembly protein SufD [Bacteriovoracaceae bacterium]|nr:Fe-S cluster assembly protein SufD [Bacteriovoracaceae bacterium]